MSKYTECIYLFNLLQQFLSQSNFSEDSDSFSCMFLLCAALHYSCMVRVLPKQYDKNNNVNIVYIYIAIICIAFYIAII